MGGERDDFAAAFAGAEGGEQPPDALARLDAEARRLVELEAYIAETEEAIKAAKAAANRIKQRTMPDIMSELRMDETVRDGFRMKLTNFVSGSLPNPDEKPEAHEKAVEYLQSLEGGANLFKTVVTIEFGRGEGNMAQSVVADLREKYGVEPKAKFGVHTQTLHAYIRERMERAEPIDTETLGIYCGTAVKVTTVSKKDRK